MTATSQLVGGVLSQAFVYGKNAAGLLAPIEGGRQLDTTPAMTTTPSALATTGTTLVSLSDISTATTLREQDSILLDPAETDVRRRFKFYFTVYRSSTGNAREVWVKFSADGTTFGLPQLCDFAGREVEDPSVATLLDTPGTVWRNAGKLTCFCEDRSTATIYGYESSDGITWTQLANNPAVPLGAGGSWEANLTGSPSARWDGARLIVGYEGVGATAESFGVAIGQPGALVKSANNPVWTPGPDPYATDSIVVDTMHRDPLTGYWYFGAHSGTSPTPGMWRGSTTVSDPAAWVDGSIATVGGRLLAAQADFTMNYADTTYRTAVVGESNGSQLRLAQFT